MQISRVHQSDNC